MVWHTVIDCSIQYTQTMDSAAHAMEHQTNVTAVATESKIICQQQNHDQGMKRSKKIKKVRKNKITIR